MVFFKFFSFFFFLGGEGGDWRQIDLYVNEMLTIILKKSTLKGDYSTLCDERIVTQMALCLNV